MKSAGFDYPYKESNITSPLPTHFKKSTEKHIFIKTDLAKVKNIGLHVNTNLHVKEKTRFKIRDVAVVLLFCLLVVHLFLTSFQTQQLRFELEETRKYVYVLSESLDTISDLYKGLQEEIKLFESLLQEKVIKDSEHSVKKREITISMTNCSSSREARSISRGKNPHSKNRNGNRRRCLQTSGPHAVHLKGSLPEISVRDGGLIAPWYIDKSYSGNLLSEGIVGEGSGILEIVEEGLYFIYAQIYYLTSSSLNSFAIKVHLHDGGGREDLSLAICSAEASTKKVSELSCYTAIVRYLHKGDRVYLSQRERNLRILFRDNKSFLGFVLLNSKPDGLVN